MISLISSCGFHGHHIRTRIGFSDGETAQILSAYQFRNVFLLELL